MVTRSGHSLGGDGVDYEPGQSSNLIFIAPESGPVELFCRYHRDEGMTGTLMVQG